MRTLIICSNLFPGSNEEPFLRSEFPYLGNEFSEIYVHRMESIPTPIDGYNILSNTRVDIPIRNLLKGNWRLLLSAWFYELRKSSHRLHYIKRFKRYFNNWMGWLQEAKAWEHALKQFDPKDTVIYTYWYEQQANAFTLLKAQGKLPFKWISRAHGWDVDKRQRANNLIPFRHWMLQYKPDHLISISNFGKDVFKQDYSAQVEVARLGTVDLGLGVTPLISQSLTIVSISAIIPLKRIDLIVEILGRTNHKITWIHYGDGPAAESLKWDNLPDNITVTKKGHTDHEKLLIELQNTPIDVMIHLSELEGIPVSIMECMSLGIPVIACDTGGVSEIVDNDCGWLLPVEFEPKQVSTLLDTIAEKRDVVSKKRLLSRAKWEKLYQADVNFPKFIHSFLSNN